jgi:hypothetical protein
MDQQSDQDAALLTAMGTSLAKGGLGHIGVIPVDRYRGKGPLGVQVLAPQTQSILVVGSGGPGLWDHMIAEIQAEHRLLTDTAHPLDACMRRVVQATDSLLVGISHRWFFATADAEVHLDFRSLAVLAGLGAPSRLGLVLHEKYGPWMGLRAACFMDRVLPSSSLADDLCAGCPAPCIGACPGGALDNGHWDVGTCAAFHQSSELCARSCAAREACPLGATYKYSDLERLYHYNREAGRTALRAHLGIADAADPFQGVGPHWGEWVSPD